MCAFSECFSVTVFDVLFLFCLVLKHCCFCHLNIGILTCGLLLGKGGGGEEIQDIHYHNSLKNPVVVGIAAQFPFPVIFEAISEA